MPPSGMQPNALPFERRTFGGDSFCFCPRRTY